MRRGARGESAAAAPAAASSASASASASAAAAAAAAAAVAVAAAVVAALVWAAPFGVARAQCTDRPIVGDHLWSNEPAPLPCIAPPPPYPPIRFALGLRLGGQHRDTPAHAVVYAPTASADVALGDHVELGVRAALQIGADAGRDTDGDGRDDDATADPVALVVTGGPRLVLPTNAGRFEALRLSLDFGALAVVSGGASSGAVIEVGLERQVGTLYVDDAHGRPSAGTGLGFTLGVYAQQGLFGAADHRALFVGATSGLELAAPLPRGPRPRRLRPAIEHTFSAGVRGGLAVGDRGGAGGALELGVGFPIGAWLAIETRVDAMLMGRAQGGDPTVFYGVLGGVRVPRYFPAYVQALVGYAWGFGTEPLEVGDGAVLDLQLGVQLTNVFGCGNGTFAAVQNRFGLAPGNEGLATVGIAIGFRHDALVGAATCD